MEPMLFIAYVIVCYVVLSVFGNALIYFATQNSPDLRERPLYMFFRLLAINDTLACLFAIPNVVVALLVLNSAVAADDVQNLINPLNQTAASPVLGERFQVFYKKSQVLSQDLMLNAGRISPVESSQNSFSGPLCALYGPLLYVWLMSAMPAHMLLAFNRLIGVTLPGSYLGLFTARFCVVIWCTFVWMPVGIVMLLYWFQALGKFSVLAASAAHICWARVVFDGSLKTLWVMVMYIPLAITTLLYLITGGRILRRWLTIRRQLIVPHKSGGAEWARSDLRVRVHGTLLTFFMFFVHVLCVLPLRILEDTGAVYDDDKEGVVVEGVPWRKRSSLIVLFVMLISVGGKWIAQIAIDLPMRRAVRVQLGYLFPIISPERENPLLPLRHRVMQQQISEQRDVPKPVPSSTSNPFHTTPTAIKLHPLIPHEQSV